jgi:hypothetical protein
MARLRTERSDLASVIGEGAQSMKFQWRNRHI